MRRQAEYGLDKLHSYYLEAWHATEKRREIFQNLINAFCLQLEIDIVPTVYLCDVRRQNDCIRKKNDVPCGGGCYHTSPTPRIFIRELWGGYDTLLHELYHHINVLNDPQAIKKIMNAWHTQAFMIKKGYGKLLKKAGIPTRRKR